MITFARAKNGEGKGNRTVRNWGPRHTAIVMDRVSGMTVDDIAEKYNLVSAHVTQICNSWQGKQLVASISARILEEKYENIDEDKKATYVALYNRIRDFAQNDKIANGAPLAYMPIALKAYEVLGKEINPIPASPNGSHVVNNIQVNVMSDPEQRNTLADGLTKSLEVMQKYASLSGESIDGSVSSAK